jgi:gas vesicle protein
MTAMLMESVVIAFTLGGIIGAVAALHLKQAPARVKARNRISQR